MEELHGCYDDKDFSEIKQTSLQLLDKVLDNLGAKFDLGTCSNVIGAAFLRYSSIRLMCVLSEISTCESHKIMSERGGVVDFT